MEISLCVLQKFLLGKLCCAKSIFRWDKMKSSNHRAIFFAFLFDIFMYSQEIFHHQAKRIIFLCKMELKWNYLKNHTRVDSFLGFLSHTALFIGKHFIILYSHLIDWFIIWERKSRSYGEKWVPSHFFLENWFVIGVDFVENLICAL